MKRYIVIIICLITYQTTFGQRNVNQLFSEFSKEKSATSVNIGKVAITFASLFTETMGVDGIDILEFDNCTQELKERFASSVKQLKDSKFETMVNSNTDNSRTKVMVRIEDEVIREMVVFTTGNSNAMVRIKGKIKPSDIERIVKKHGNG